jgi:general secretion pathway protein E
VTFVARALFGFAVCCLAAAFATIALWTEASGVSAAASRLASLSLDVLGEPPFVWVTCAAAAAGALWVGSAALETLTRSRAGSSTPTYEAYGKVNMTELTREVRRRIEESLSVEPASVVRAFDEIVRGALSAGASDVHVSPTPEAVRVTYRVYGTLYEAASLDPRWAQPFATRVKVLAGLETHVRKKSQDGRLVMQLDGVSVEARVSTLPTEVGERIVLRIVRGSLGIPELSSLEFSDETRRGLIEVLARPQGMLFVTGPVGSGKTTTLYSALKHLVDTRGKTTSLVTLEDPIEIELPFATQTQIHNRAGRSFASTLRSVLRQDPNVLMVGEIRDQETADIATQAGLTGHLILTTLHADSAAGPFTRLIDMDVEPFVVASATVGCLSQRLVRTLCTACRRPVDPDPAVRSRLEALGETVPEGRYYAPVGCEYCEGEGFAGRAPIAELLRMRGELRDAVIACKPTSEIYALARRHGMTPLLSDGLARAARGETSLEEVLRVAG